MKLARELSLSCWMFVFTSGRTSWSGGCLGQQNEYLKKSVCSGTGCHERWGVCGDVCERQKLGDTSLKCCVCFLFHGWCHLFPRGTPLLVVAISKGFMLQGCAEHLLHPIPRDPLQSRASHSFNRVSLKPKSTTMMCCRKGAGVIKSATSFLFWNLLSLQEGIIR